MNIGMLGPISWRTPPRAYGAWETVVHNLTEGLVARGQQVTLFATGDSISSATLHAVCPRPYSEDPDIDPNIWVPLHISEAMERAAEFDVLHSHLDFLPLTYSRLVGTPLLTTIHGFSSEAIKAIYLKYWDNAYVSISNSDRDPRLNYLATVYNGIDLTEFTFRANPAGGYLLYLGRFHPEKGVHLAIDVALRTGLPLVIAGIQQDREYWERDIAPRLDGRQIRFVGEAGPRERDELMGNALACLHLVTRPERFGLTMAESMACGTPVVAMDLGSPREVLGDGISGRLVHSVDEAVEAVRGIERLDRAACRAWVASRFSVDHMVDGYLRVYERLIG
ncbi:MAG TPA: glycosyltransferase family 4 protein [Chloroflexota bacterium]|nr:glycosyltransferase family 4 protein [Chloroflexota bacterium]